MTPPGKPQLDGVGCLLLFITYLFTGLSYEVYHWMRQEELGSFDWFLYAIGSIMSTVLASFFLKAAVKK